MTGFVAGGHDKHEKGCAAQDESQHQRADEKPDANSADHGEEIERVAGDGVRPVAHQLAILLRAYIEHAPHPSHDADKHQNDADRLDRIAAVAIKPGFIVSMGSASS